MSNAMKYIQISELSIDQKRLYSNSTQNSYPLFIKYSTGVEHYWERMEKYFPEFQLALVDEKHQLIGTINSVPFHWDKNLEDLPHDGWDWLIKKSVEDYERNIQANFLGGIQINILAHHRSKGFSKKMIAKAKSLKSKHNLDNFILPIRPTLKWKFPELSMGEYIQKKVDNQLYDPWIRTHLNSGARVIKVCNNSMNVSGDINFWEKALGQSLKKSEYIQYKGALNPIEINIENNHGEYREENIWIKYF